MCAVPPLDPVAEAPSVSPRRGLGIVRWGPALGLAGAALYFELKADPSWQRLSHVPTAWLRVLDGNDFLVNAGGFGALAAAVHFGVLGCSRQPWRAVAVRAAWLAGVIVLLELAQLFIPQRSCDWLDMAAGALGVALASLPWVRFTSADIPHGD